MSSQWKNVKIIHGTLWRQSSSPCLNITSLGCEHGTSGSCLRLALLCLFSACQPWENFHLSLNTPSDLPDSAKGQCEVLAFTERTTRVWLGLAVPQAAGWRAEMAFSGGPKCRPGVKGLGDWCLVSLASAPICFSCAICHATWCLRNNPKVLLFY